MAHPLDGAIAKRNRAREQIKSLDAAIRASVEDRPYRVVVAERERYSSSSYALRFEPGQISDPPAEWSAIIGEIAHDLRSALDLLACELALFRSATTDIRDVSFPIRLYGPAANPAPRKPRWRGDLVAPFGRPHRARIERLQPYHRRNGRRRNFLWLLQELNNADKHRTIQTLAVSAGRITPRTLRMTRDPDDVFDSPALTGFEFRQGVPLRDGAKVGRINITLSAKASADLDARISAKVVFDTGCDAVRGLEVIRFFADADAAVLNTLRLFAGDLKPE